jgi:hypothetical protein
MSTDTIDWWLAYWCDLYKKTTIFTGGAGEKLTKSDTLEDKIVCTSSSWYSGMCTNSPDLIISEN